MALVLGKFDGGATKASFASVLGITAKQYRQFILFADPGNSATVRFGPVALTSAANEKLRLAAGASMNLGPQGSDRPFVVDVEALYVVGSAASQVCYFIANTDDGR